MNKTMTEKIVTISSPDMGIAKRIPNIHRISLFSRVSEFVRGIIGHYVRLQEPWPMITLVFRQLGMGDTFLNSYHTHITPRLNFTLLRWHPGSPVPTGSLSHTLRLRTLKETVTRLVRPASAYRIEQIAPDQIVRRLFSRSERIEIPQRTQDVGLRQDSYRRAMKEAAKPTAETEYLPVRRIVHRIRTSEQERFSFHSRVLEQKQSDYHAQDKSTVQDLQKKQKEAQKVQPSPIPSIDVNRLTEQVIQEIDRRIASQRERMGRL